MAQKALFWDNLHDQATILHALEQNQVVVGSSDTILGLLAPLSLEGRLKLDQIKERQDKPYIVLISDIDKMKLFTDQHFPESIQNLMKKCWPGPLTLIVKAKAELPAWLTSAQTTIALRIPAHKGLLALLQHCNGLFSTSANKAGESAPQTIAELDPTILAQCAYTILDCQEAISTTPSTIVDVSQEQLKLVREGAYIQKQLKEFE